MRITLQRLGETGNRQPARFDRPPMFDVPDGLLRNPGKLRKFALRQATFQARAAEGMASGTTFRRARPNLRTLRLGQKLIRHARTGD